MIHTRIHLKQSASELHVLFPAVSENNKKKTVESLQLPSSQTCSFDSLVPCFIFGMRHPVWLRYAFYLLNWLINKPAHSLFIQIVLLG